MKINRILPHFLTSDVYDDEKAGKCEKSFEETLREEQEKLMRLLSEEPEIIDDFKKFYQIYNERMIDDSFFDK